MLIKPSVATENAHFVATVIDVDFKICALRHWETIDQLIVPERRDQIGGSAGST